MVQMQSFDVLVVGAGHAGVEAALAVSRLGQAVGIVTLRRAGVAQMSCNPAIGGVGKGHLVREIVALGGAMGSVADATAIQARKLNLSRGPAVRSTRVQSDAAQYKAAMAQRLAAAPHVTLLEDEVVDLHLVAGRAAGVMCRHHGLLRAGAVIVTTGTFLGGVCHIGAEQFGGGRVGDAPANALSLALGRLGIRLERFKTGTTPRLHRDSIAWGELEAQHGDLPRPTFCSTPPAQLLPQVPCYLTHTTAATHRLVQDNLQRSPLYGGTISGVGPRYCPSLEDKVVRFAAKASHQIFLEPESLTSSRIYPNGLSTSLPRDVQEAFVRTLPGLQNAHIEQHGYAVEYDYAPPTQLQPSLQTKAVPNLFLAGQINGTSGYEEAAAQGLMAGLNAVRLLRSEPAAVLGRAQAYIGVLIDDLVTRGVDEPYRMFTARAEHRLTLREGNAEARLAELAANWGLTDPLAQQAAATRAAHCRSLHQVLHTAPLSAAMAAALALGDRAVGRRLAEVLRRPEVSLEALRQAAARLDATLHGRLQADLHTTGEVEDSIKYAGYIAREAQEIAKLREIEHIKLPPSLTYEGVPGLSTEVREKLQAVAPRTLGQAGRISGMTPAALTLLRAYLHRRQAA
ncbi:MAG: tRNA uridine-5-carboxymethylaminomethyl(34) synthesis enzyme MnmG [Deltaproteobacteria bacterium]|nr:MAG: tRNA uridine-5-carboxymethylaminomethyl(34) synthesis enzyme MnmG [Deltaproteobacteria bacterium]